METVIRGLMPLVFAALVVVAIAPVSAQQPETQPNVTANPDGSCTLHRRRASDFHIDKGATYHQEEIRGKKSGVIYVPDRTYLCQDGHLHVVK